MTVTLHDEMKAVLLEAGTPLPTDVLADRVNARNRYARSDGGPVPANQVSARAHRYLELFTVDSTRKPSLVGLTHWHRSRPEGISREQFVSMLEDLCDEMIQHLLDGGYQPEHGHSKGTVDTFQRSFDWLVRYAKGERFVRQR